MGLDELTHWCERAVALGAGVATPMYTRDVVVAEWVRSGAW